MAVSQKLEDWSSELLSNLGLQNFFTHRNGGVSPAPYDSLNLGMTTKDDPSNVLKNREKVKEATGISLRSVAWQVHGGDVLTIRHGDPIPIEPKLPNADAIVTDRPGFSMAMFFADCLAVFIWDPVERVAGLAHAGWRSTILDIVGNTIQKMEREFDCKAENIRAAIGPSIGPCCFEVGRDVADQFDRPFVLQREDKLFVDLWSANKAGLLARGVNGGHIEMAGECTYCRKDDYFSYRRDHGITGRMAGAVCIPQSKREDMETHG